MLTDQTLNPDVHRGGEVQWVGLQRLLLEMGLPASTVMALGDGSNDLEMVQNCGVGVAMSNAVPKVSAIANIPDGGPQGL